MAIINYKTTKKNRKIFKKLSKRRKTKHKSYKNSKTLFDYLLKRTRFQYGGDLTTSSAFGLSYNNSLVLPQISDPAQISVDLTKLTKLKKDLLVQAPNFKVPEGYSGHLIMYDPDAPNPANNPHIFVHWIIKFNGSSSSNYFNNYKRPPNKFFDKNPQIPYMTKSTKKPMTNIYNILLPYMGPTPPFGTHRYIFIFLENNSNILKIVTDQLNESRLTNTNDIRSIIQNNKILAQFGYKVASN